MLDFRAFWQYAGKEPRKVFPRYEIPGPCNRSRAAQTGRFGEFQGSRHVVGHALRLHMMHVQHVSNNTHDACRTTRRHVSNTLTLREDRHGHTRHMTLALCAHHVIASSGRHARMFAISGARRPVEITTCGHHARHAPRYIMSTRV